MAEANEAYLVTLRTILRRLRDTTPSTTLEKNDSSDARRPEWPEWIESWLEAGRLRLESKSSLSMEAARLELREGMGIVHCHPKRRE